MHYRMHPDNVGCLAAVRPDVCVLANNHVLDFGERGLRETLATLERAGLRAAGAGADTDRAERPARVRTDGGRVLVWSVADGSSGVPSDWAAADGRPGVAVVRGLSEHSAAGLAERVRREKRAGDIAVVSIHWGSNWGYDIPRAQRRFAHRLVDGGVDVVHGHSSHHPRPVEVYRGRLILYGCGDLVNDYEGIGGHEEYRDDLRLLYLPSLAPSGELRQLRMVPVRARRMRLEQAAPADADWLRRVLTATGRGFGCRLDADAEGDLVVRPV